jgi:hypothetical protein
VHSDSPDKANASFTTTNLTAKVSLSRVVLEGGKLENVARDVAVEK